MKNETRPEKSPESNRKSRNTSLSELVIRDQSTKRIIWRPQKKQLAFMERFEDEALYGGAAGGGKSDCALVEALRQVNIPTYRALILRKTYPQLSDLIDRSRDLYSKAFPTAKYNDTHHSWTFQSGAKIFFGSLQHTDDRLNYQGKRYDFIDFDELTQFTYDEYIYLLSRNRPGGDGTRCYVRAQANPGGIGHGWVKERFITPAPPMTTIRERVNIVSPDEGEIWKERTRIFVPSTVFDNKILLKNDPGYLLRLGALPEKEKKALLYGDWDSFSGQVFSEWRNDPDAYESGIGTHVISPFPIPKEWKIYRSFDWGYSRPFSVGWYAVDNDMRLYRIRELYGFTGKADEGVKWSVSDVALKIREIEENDPNLKGRFIIGVADPAIFQKNGGESIGEIMEKHGVYWEKADNSRIAGKQQIHGRLKLDKSSIPMFYCFSTCKQFIRTFPSLVYDTQNVEDVDTHSEDHIYDEFRYMCMRLPIKMPDLTPKYMLTRDPADPLELGTRMIIKQ